MTDTSPERPNPQDSDNSTPGDDATRRRRTAGLAGAAGADMVANTAGVWRRLQPARVRG